MLGAAHVLRSIVAASTVRAHMTLPFRPNALESRVKGRIVE